MLEAFDGAALGAVVAGIDEDLNTAQGTDKFQVDLQALHDYYYQVHDLWMHLNQYARGLPTDPYSRACINTSAIPGVASAIQASVDGALGDTSSMTGAVASVTSSLGQHLQALADVYTAYVNVDHQNATELTQAGTPAAAKINVNVPGSPTPASTPAWAKFVIN